MGSGMGGGAQGPGSAKAVLAGCFLAAAVVLWSLLTSVAPEFGAMLAIFGSPVLAWVILLRLLTLPARRPGSRGNARQFQWRIPSTVDREALTCPTGPQHDRRSVDTHPA